MLASLRYMPCGASRPVYPSTVLMLGTLATGAHCLHIVPEDGTVESFSRMSPSATTFSRGGATETTREELGIVLLHNGDGDGEGVWVFLDEVGERTKKLLEGSTGEKDVGAVNPVAATEDALKKAALEGMKEREGREPPNNAAEEYPVFLVRIERSRPGRLFTDAELTSFPR